MEDVKTWMEFYLVRESLDMLPARPDSRSNIQSVLGKKTLKTLF